VIEALKLVTVEVESWSQTPSLPPIEAPASIWLVHTILTTFYYIHHAATGDVVKCF
jgi:hypothetical protein